MNEFSMGELTLQLRRVYPSLFASKLVGVQPMRASVGLAHALKFKYDRTDIFSRLYDAFYADEIGDIVEESILTGKNNERLYTL